MITTKKKKKDTRKYADRAEYLKMAVKRRRKMLRQKAVEYKSNKCFFCGYSKYIGALDFHHINEKTKEFGLSEKGMTRSWQRTKTELDKCILVCANCHREIHGGILQLPTEMLVENRVNCPAKAGSRTLINLKSGDGKPNSRKRDMAIRSQACQGIKVDRKVQRLESESQQ